MSGFFVMCDSAGRGAFLCQSPGGPILLVAAGDFEATFLPGDRVGIPDFRDPVQLVLASALVRGWASEAARTPAELTLTAQFLGRNGRRP